MDLTRQLDRVIRQCARKRVRHQVSRRIGIMDEDDLVSHVWVKLLDNDAAHLRKMMKAEHSLSACVRRFANFRMLEVLNKQKIRDVLAPMELTDEERKGSTPTPEEQVVAMDTEGCFKKCMDDSLTAKEKSVFKLWYGQGRSNKEIAKILGLTPQSVANHINRIRNKARVCLTHCAESKHNNPPGGLE